MKLIYYRDGENKAFCAKIEENSLEMFLYEKARWQRRFPKLMIEEALETLEALSEARDAIQMLEADEETGGVDNA